MRLHKQEKQTNQKIEGVKLLTCSNRKRTKISKCYKKIRCCYKDGCKGTPVPTFRSDGYCGFKTERKHFDAEIICFVNST